MNGNKTAPCKPGKDGGKQKAPVREIEPDDEEDGDIATPKRDRDDEDQAGI